MHKNFFSRSSIKSFQKEKVDNKARRPEITENISCAIRIDQKTIKTFFQKLHLITYEMQLRACAWGKVNVCGNVCDDLEEENLENVQIDFCLFRNQIAVKCTFY